MQGPPGRRPHPGAVLSPVRAAAPYIGAPYRLHGRTPDGWDCWGCVRFLRAEIFGLQSPSWGEAYDVASGRDPAHVEALILDRIAQWQETDVKPGAVILFEYFGRKAHVGLALSGREFIHTLPGHETALDRLDDRWRRRFRGAYEART